MGRNMFGGGRGPWDDAWRGWWGEDPPFHTPVFVLTHHAREPLEMQGGTTFHFVTDGVEAALERARGGRRRARRPIAGGAEAVQQYLAAGLLDEFYLHIVAGPPRRRRAAARRHVGDPRLETVKPVASPAVTHVKYRVAR